VSCAGSPSAWMESGSQSATSGGQSKQPDAGDKAKSPSPNALKRAAVKFGIGRYLYRLPNLGSLRLKEKGTSSDAYLAALGSSQESEGRVMGRHEEGQRELWGLHGIPGVGPTDSFHGLDAGAA
jgi:hypothetical protein